MSSMGPFFVNDHAGVLLALCIDAPKACLATIQDIRLEHPLLHASGWDILDTIQEWCNEQLRAQHQADNKRLNERLDRLRADTREQLLQEVRENSVRMVCSNGFIPNAWV